MEADNKLSPLLMARDGNDLLKDSSWKRECVLRTTLYDRSVPVHPSSNGLPYSVFQDVRPDQPALRPALAR